MLIQACLALATGLALDGPAKPFADLSFAEARQRAHEEGKHLFVEFVVDVCIASKRMDRETFSDPTVQEWLREHCVSIQLDADVEAALSKQYAVHAFPALLFFRPDGELLERHVGFLPADQFILKSEEILTGIDLADRLVKRVAEHPSDPRVHQLCGDALVQKRRFEEALDQYLWCYDQALEHDPSYADVRSGLLLTKIRFLGGMHLPAVQALRDRRDAARERVKAGDATLLVTEDFATLSDALGEPEVTLEAYDALPDGADELARMLFPHVTELLVETSRYQDIADGPVPFEQLVAPFTHALGEVDFSAEPLPPTSGALVTKVSNYGTWFFQAFLALRRDQEANQVAERLLALIPTHHAAAALAVAAEDAGRTDVSAKMHERAGTVRPDEHGH